MDGNGVDAMMTRNRKRIWVVTIWLLFIVGACQVSQTGTAEQPGDVSDTTLEAQPELTGTAIPTPTLTSTSLVTEELDVVMPTATLQPVVLKPHYAISATLDYSAHRVNVTETIDYPNTTGVNLSDITLVMDANQIPGVFHLLRVSYCDGDDIDVYGLDGIRIDIPLVVPLKPEEHLKLCLQYNLELPPITKSENFSPNPFGYTYRQVNLVNWYPFVPPYEESKGWVVHHPWYYGEHLVYPVADFDVSLVLKRAPESTLVAASADAVDESGEYRYHLTNGRNFVFSVSHLYKMLEAEVAGTKILGYVFPGDYQAGEAAFQATVDAFELYSTKYGAYSHPVLTMVEADFDHGMEYQGLYYLSRAFFNLYDGTPKGYLVSIAAHETAHQWWYAAVANDQAMEPWLDESLCTFSEHLFYEFVHPDALAWWQQVRVDYYQPAGWVNSNIYDAGGYRPYVNAVYLNGATFLQDLRQAMGDDAFFAFLQDYLEENRGKIATADSFFSVLKQHTSVDIDKIKEKYFSTP